MVNPKPLSMVIILLVLFLGLYEKQTGTVISVAHFSRRADAAVHYKMVPGDVLVYFSLFLAAIASFVFRKD